MIIIYFYNLVFNIFPVASMRLFTYPLAINWTAAMDRHWATSTAWGCFYLKKVLRQTNTYTRLVHPSSVLECWLLTAHPQILFWGTALGWQVLPGSSSHALGHLCASLWTELLVRSGWGWTALQILNLCLPSFPALSYFPHSVTGVFWEQPLNRPFRSSADAGSNPIQNLPVYILDTNFDKAIFK